MFAIDYSFFFGWILLLKNKCIFFNNTAGKQVWVASYLWKTQVLNETRVFKVEVPQKDQLVRFHDEE
jgi:hypothetical protein